MKDDTAWRQLLERYMKGECTDAERLEVDRWYQSLADQASHEISLEELEEDSEIVLKRIRKASRQPRISMIARVTVAAMVLVAATFSIVFLRPTDAPEEMALSAVDTLDAAEIMPGSDKAVLELSDGRVITINGAEIGALAADSFGTIVKDGDGSLTYEGFQRHEGLIAPPPMYNTFRTPRGGQFQVTLPDGSRVWLNAESSMTYAPNRFRGERILTLEGEAYFDVVTDPDRPLVVRAAEQTIVVYGTQFNVSCYREEPVAKTTLVEGSLSISTREGNTRYLVPGEQASLDGTGRLRVSKGNIQQATAWRNGVFSFDGADIGEVMRQLSRWYDVDVVFEGKTPDMKLWGDVNRNTSAATPLEFLEFFELNHRVNIINGKKQVTIFTN